MRGSKRRAIDNRNKQQQDHFPKGFSDCMADNFDAALKFRGADKSKRLTPFEGIAIKYVMKKEKLSNRRYKRMQRGKAERKRNSKKEVQFMSEQSLKKNRSN